MSHRHVILAALLVMTLYFPALAGPTATLGDVRRGTSWSANSFDGGAKRAKGAHARRAATVKALFVKANVVFPPAKVLLRAYKKEAQLEVWASSTRGDAMKKVATYSICSQGDGLGPKLRQGDGKTPEGFYRLDFYNRRSSFHLSMRINYPNRLDRQLGRTGSAIMIHGACVSIGCLAMTDERIEELWVITRAAARRAPVAVHVFPARDMASLIARSSNATLRRFWQDIKVGHDAFEKDHKLPRVAVERGRYVVRDAKPTRLLKTASLAKATKSTRTTKSLLPSWLN